MVAVPVAESLDLVRADSVAVAYLWFYARVLWDNPFLIPLGALAMAGYAAHLRSGSTAGVYVTVGALLMMPLVHLMSLALVLPLSAHLVAFRWRSLWRHRFGIAAIGTCVLIAGWPYWRYLLSARSAGASAASDPSGWFFPLFGGRLLSARGLT